MTEHTSFIEISKSAYKNNIRFIRSQIGEKATISSVIKGNDSFDIIVLMIATNNVVMGEFNFLGEYEDIILSLKEQFLISIFKYNGLTIIQNRFWLIKYD